MSWEHVQNADCRTVGAWLKSGDLPGHIFGVKGTMRRKWKTERVLIGPPRATEWHSVADLLIANVIGLYAERA